MTYGCAARARRAHVLDGAAVSHSAELVRGDFISLVVKAPLIRPSGAPSPQGEKGRCGALALPTFPSLTPGNLWRVRHTQVCPQGPERDSSRGNSVSCDKRMNRVHNFELTGSFSVAVLRPPDVRCRGPIWQCTRGVPAFGSGTNCRRNSKPPHSPTHRKSRNRERRARSRIVGPVSGFVRSRRYAQKEMRT